MAKVNKTIKLEIIKPLYIDWKELSKLLRDNHYMTWKIKNTTVRYMEEWYGFNSDYKEQHGIYPKNKDILGVQLRTYINRQVKPVYYQMNSANVESAVQIAYEDYENKKDKIFRGKARPPNYRRDCPIELRDINVNLEEGEKGYVAKLSLLSQPGKKEWGYKGNNGGQVAVAIRTKDPSTKTILKRMLNGEYKKGNSRIVWDSKKRKWFLNISYSFDSYGDKIPKTDNVMGVDLGIINAVYMAFTKSKKRYVIGGGEIDSFRKQVYSRRNSMLEQGKFCGEGRKGHGRDTKLKPINKLRDKVGNFKDTINHRYSKYIIEVAIENECKAIQLESLKGINEDSKFLKNWTYHDLQTKIEYKAEEVGIDVHYVDPAYTSQTCSNCGHVDKKNRKNQSKFVCENCGFNENADYNAALNIAKSTNYVKKESEKVS